MKSFILAAIAIILPLPCESSVRLVGGKTEKEGRVEILHNGKWGTICGSGWDSRNAQVICRMMGYSSSSSSSSSSLSTSIYGPGQGHIWLDGVRCNGDEGSIDQCKSKSWGRTDCDHDQDVGVICSSSLPSVRLVGGSTNWEGRVEISFNGTWGTICHDRWDSPDSDVICRMLGYSSGSKLSTNIFGPGVGKIWLNVVGCTGKESSIDQCEGTYWGWHSCTHKDDVALICLATQNNTPLEMKAVDSKTLSVSSQYTTTTTHEVSTDNKATSKLPSPHTKEFVSSSTECGIELLHHAFWAIVLFLIINFAAILYVIFRIRSIGRSMIWTQPTDSICKTSFSPAWMI